MWGRNSLAEIRRRRNAVSSTATALPAVEWLEQRSLLSAATVQVLASHDNTIYDVTTGDLSNGSGEYIIVGGAVGNAAARRGLISFDLSSANIPAGATVLDVVLSMNLTQSVGGAATVGVHRLLKSWGEAGSNASADEIEGARAEPLDATWLFSRFDSSAWGNPGGDFAGASGAAQVDTPGAYEWFGGGLISDVQDWLDHPDTNFGWLLKGSEVAGNIKSFISRDSAAVALHPTLEITYELPVLPGVIEGRSWVDGNGNGLRESPIPNELQLQFRNGNNFYNVFGGQEYWYHSGPTNSWYFLTGSGELTRWSGEAGRLTGTVTTQLGPRAWYSPEAWIASPVSTYEPWLNGQIIQLVNERGEVVAVTTSGNIDINGDGRIQVETEQGWYRFEGVQPGNYTVRQVPMENWKLNATSPSPEMQEAWRLRQTLGLTNSGSLFENFGGLGERWLRGTQAWYYITPAGALYQWNGRAVTNSNPLTGTLVASPGISYYRDPTLLYAATNPVISVTAGAVQSQVNFGSYVPAVINGQTWVDGNPDGIRNSPTLSELIAISSPTDLSLARLGQQWFAIPVAGTNQPIVSFGSPDLAAYFYTTAVGQVYQWSPVTGTTLLTTISAASGLTPQTVIQQAFQNEPLENGLTVQLVDEQGNVIASTVSAPRDLNGDGQITLEENGWYEFSGLVPGRYSVRTVTPSGMVQVSQGDALQEASAAGFRRQFGFKAAVQDHFNFGGRHERWFLGSSNQWFFITPDGTIYEWNRSSGGVNGLARGTQIGRLSSSYYLNLNLLFRSVPSALTVQSHQQSSVNLGSLRVIDSLFASLADEFV